MQPLSALDALFLHLETVETPMHVGVLHLLTPPGSGARGYADAVRRHIADRLPYAPVLTRRLRKLPLSVANPVWETAEDIDLESHVRAIRLRQPGSQAQLLRAVADLHAVRLDLDRPPWTFFVFEGLESGKLALYTKIHHAAIDGAAGVALALALLDPDAGSRRALRPPRQPPVESSLVSLLSDSVRRNAKQAVKTAGALPAMLRAAAELLWAESSRLRPAPRTRLNVAVGSERRVATASLPLESIQAVARTHAVTVNDVVLALVSAALRLHLGALGELPPQPLVAAMPVSLRAAGDERPTTLATMTLARLATDIADPLERLRVIHEQARSAKSFASRLDRIVPTDFPSVGLPWLLSVGAKLYGRSRIAERIPPIANLVVSNVPGPRTHLFLAGARLESWWPLSIVEHGLGLNITVESYAGSLDFGLVAAANAIADLEPLARGIESALHEFDRPVKRTSKRAPVTAPHRKK